MLTLGMVVKRVRILWPVALVIGCGSRKPQLRGQVVAVAALL